MSSRRQLVETAKIELRCSACLLRFVQADLLETANSFKNQITNGLTAYYKKTHGNNSPDKGEYAMEFVASQLDEEMQKSADLCNTLGGVAGCKDRKLLETVGR